MIHTAAQPKCILRRHIRAAVAIAVAAASPLYSQSGVRTRDSAGVQIVENPARAKQPVTLSLSLQPRMEVGGLQTTITNEFNTRSGHVVGALLSDGALVVLDKTRLHFFDPAGRLLRIVGREGSGPGEYLNLNAVCRTRGDTIVVSDESAQRLSVFDRVGQLVRSIPSDQSGFAFTPYGCFDDGTFPRLRRASDPADPQAQFNVARFDLKGVRQGDIGTFDVMSDFIHRWTIKAAGSRLYVAKAIRSEVGVYLPDGMLSMLIRTDDPVKKLTDSEIDAVALRAMPLNAPSEQRVNARTAVRKALNRSSWPAYSAIVVGSDGRLWVQDYDATNAKPMGWTVFDQRGRLEGRLMIPRNFRSSTSIEILQFMADGVLLSRKDEDGARRLGFYPFVRSAGAK